MKPIAHSFLLILLYSPIPFVAADSFNPSVQLPQLKAAAEVVRDAYGIAHIRAGNEHDGFFLQGYVHAQDRLFQMDVSRRRASGTLAAVLGTEALSSDVLFRTLGLRRAAERSLALHSTRAKNAIEAYSAGINAYISQHPLPPEYGALEITEFDPWSAVDTLVVAKLLAFVLSFDTDDIDRTVALLSYQLAGAQLGFNGEALFFEDVFRFAPFDPASTVPDARRGANATQDTRTAVTPTRKTKTPITPQTKILGQRYLERVRATPYLRKLLDQDTPGGSNQWVISGTYTVSGMPLLANDPHLTLATPSTVYPIHLKAGGMDVIGNGFPGVPSVVIGHNRHIAWGATVNRIDVVDYYQEQLVPDAESPSGFSTLYRGQREHVIAIPERFTANLIADGIANNHIEVPPGNGIPAATLIVPRRNQGPIIELDQTSGNALSVQYTGFSATRELDAFLAIDIARNLDDFKSALQYFDFGSQNFAYADTQGNIGYFTSAELPLREDLQAGVVTGLPPYFIRNGQGGNEWLPVTKLQPNQAIAFEILPYDEMPQIVNPPRGWFVNANNDPAGTTLDNNPLNQLRPDGGIYYLHARFQGGFRAGRITEILETRLEDPKAGMTFADMQRMQADTVMRDAQALTPYLLQAMKNAKRDGAHPLLAGYANDTALNEATERLASWQHDTPTGIREGFDANDSAEYLHEPTTSEIDASVAATLYSVWRGQFIRNVIDNKLVPYGLPVPKSQQTMAALRHLLDSFEQNHGRGASGIDFFALPDVDNAHDRRDIVILMSLKQTLERLAGEPFAAAFHYSSTQSDYRWGLLHRIVFEHPLGEPFSIPPAGGVFPAPLPGLPGIPTDGGFQVPDASAHDTRAQDANSFMFDEGPSNRFVAQINQEQGIYAESVWPGGVSGVLGQANYANLLPLWLSNSAIPLMRQHRSIIDNAQKTTRFRPSQGLLPSGNNSKLQM